MARVRITPIDGIGRTGGAVWLIQQGRSAFLIDFGSDLERSGQLLGGRIRPRASRGLHDPIELGLVPTSLDVYREDLVLDRTALEEARNVSVTDLFLTHCHADHAGRLYALDPEIRVHATPVTVAHLLADSMSSRGLYGELTHFIERQPHPTQKGILTVPRTSEREGRRVLTLGGPPSDNLRRIWRGEGSDSGFATSDGLVGDIRVEHFPVDHSVWGACAYVVHSDQGAVVHAGDLRWHGSESDLTEAFVRRLHSLRPRVLILEGTRLGRSNDEYITESQVRKEIVGAVKTAGKRLVIAMVSPKNTERLAAFLYASQLANRRLVISPRMMLTLESIAAADPYYTLVGQEGLCMYDSPAAYLPRWHRDLKERFPKTLVTPDDIRSNPKRFVYLSAFGQQMSWADIRPFNARLIYSSSSAYDAEGVDKARILRHWAEHYLIDPIGIEFSRGKVVFDPALNASGHCHPRDLERLLKRARPEAVVPCHTAHPHLLKDLLPEGVKLVTPQNDHTIRL